MEKQEGPWRWLCLWLVFGTVGLLIAWAGWHLYTALKAGEAVEMPWPAWGVVYLFGPVGLLVVLEGVAAFFLVLATAGLREWAREEGAGAWRWLRERLTPRAAEKRPAEKKGGRRGGRRKR